MDKYILTYQYVGENETFTLGSSDKDYLRDKVTEFVNFSDKSMMYQIVQIIANGIVNKSE